MEINIENSYKIIINIGIELLLTSNRKCKFEFLIVFLLLN